MYVCDGVLAPLHTACARHWHGSVLLLYVLPNSSGRLPLIQSRFLNAAAIIIEHFSFIALSHRTIHRMCIVRLNFAIAAHSSSYTG